MSSNSDVVLLYKTRDYISKLIQSRSRDFLQPVLVESWYLLNVHCFPVNRNSVVKLKSCSKDRNRIMGRGNKESSFLFVSSSSLQI